MKKRIEKLKVYMAVGDILDAHRELISTHIRWERANPGQRRDIALLEAHRIFEQRVQRLAKMALEERD